MRYVTEFEILPIDLARDKNVDKRIEYSKLDAAARLGELIASKIGWEERPHGGKRFQLSVQCFSWKDWVAFKSEIEHLVPTPFQTSLQKLFSRFESANAHLYESENKIDK